jgi:acyl-coenzyme A synthetase/AMP-(fatty) acid ligase
MLAHVSGQHGDNDFVVSLATDGSTERVTYREAERDAALLARSLLALGVSKGVRVGILAPNGPAFAIATLAATRIGAVAVPINTFFQPRELAWMLRHADVHTVLTTSGLVQRDIVDLLERTIPELCGADGAHPLEVVAFPSLRRVVVLDGQRPAWSADTHDLASEDMLKATEASIRPADDLMVIYTSGSTSEPKGIIHVHGTVLPHAHFIASGHEWHPDDRVYVPMAFFWVGGLIFGLLGPMQMGVTILTEHRFDPGEVVRFLGRERVTYATGFPHVGPALAAHPAFADTDLSSLRGGYQQNLLSPDHRMPDPTLLVAQLGMTETCTSHTWWPPNEPLPESKRGSLGVSAPGFEHKIVDERGEVVSTGVVGEICVRGRPMMRGMVGKLRDEVFDSDGWYHTGDAAHVDDDGHLYFTGRTDDMIKTSGANVAPVEVENVLLAVPEVREAYVVGLPDDERGATVVAVVVLTPAAALTADALARRCRRDLAAYKVPRRWVLCASPDALPYTTTNKIDKRKLIEQLADGAIPIS